MEPDPPASRLRQEQRAEQSAQQQTQQTQAALEFEHAEEVLRHDRAQHPPPETLASRLKASVAATPPPPRPWWRRWLGR